MSKKLSQFKTEIILFLSAALAYIPGVIWGIPYASDASRIKVWAYDDISPLGPLTEVYNTFIKAAPDRWLAYPLFHHFTLAISYSPYLLWLKLTGQFRNPTSQFPYGFNDPIHAFAALTIIARIVSILMAAGIVVAAYKIGTTLWGKRDGIFAAIVILVLYPMLYYSKTANLEVPSLFWTSLGLVVYSMILMEGVTLTRSAILGTFAALATATKDQLAGMFIFFPLIFILITKQRKQDGIAWWKSLLVFAGTGFIVYALGSGLAFDPDRYFAHIQWGFNKNAVLFGEYMNLYPFTPSGVIGLSGEILKALALILGPLLFLLCIFGIVQELRKKRIQAAFVLPALSYILLIIASIHFFKLRYAMPLIFVFGIFAARGMEVCTARLRKRSELRGTRPSQIARKAILVACLAWPICLSAGLMFQMLFDSRYEAEQWLHKNMNANKSVGYCGTASSLPRFPSEVEIVSLSNSKSTGESRPEFVLIIPDWTSSPQMPYSQHCAEFYKNLRNGSLGYRLAAKFKTSSFESWQLLDYPSVNPTVEIFAINN